MSDMTTQQKILPTPPVPAPQAAIPHARPHSWPFLIGASVRTDVQGNAHRVITTTQRLLGPQAS